MCVRELFFAHFVPESYMGVEQYVLISQIFQLKLTECWKRMFVRDPQRKIFLPVGKWKEFVRTLEILAGPFVHYYYLIETVFKTFPLELRCCFWVRRIRWSRCKTGEKRDDVRYGYRGACAQAQSMFCFIEKPDLFDHLFLLGQQLFGKFHSQSACIVQCEFVFCPFGRIGTPRISSSFSWIDLVRAVRYADFPMRRKACRFWTRWAAAADKFLSYVILSLEVNVSELPLTYYVKAAVLIGAHW